MKVFLTGSTGYLGRYVLKSLTEAGHEVVALVRSAPPSLGKETRIQYLQGDILAPEQWTGRLQDCDAIVHLVSIIKERRSRGITFQKLNVESTRHLISAARQHGIRRFIYMSALGADRDGATAYFRTKGKAEDLVKASGLDYTIFRPSFIFGYDHPVYTMLASVIRKIPFGFMPVFGDGRYRHQPVFVENVAQLVAQAITGQSTVNRIYDVGGPNQLSYREQLKIIADRVGKSVRPIHIPLWLAQVIVRIVGPLPFSPINKDQLAMLIRDSVCDVSPVVRDFDIEWVSFEKGLQTMAI